MTIHQRTISRVWTVEPQPQGPNHTVGLVLEPGHWQEFDPFLLLAEDWFGRGVFDIHPHRGQETVTYVIEGTLEHYDNKAGSGELHPGDVQWMTAGRGVLHNEVPAEGQTVHSLQLWVNLPRSQKMAQPRYQNLRGQDMPVRREDGATIRVFSGASGGVMAPTLNHTPVTMVELTLDAGATVSQDLPASFNGFLYILAGSGTFGAEGTAGTTRQVLWLGEVAGSASDDMSEVQIHATEPLKALLYAGQPLGEPVVQYGPFVMNTQGEIRQAFEDYNAGKFGE